MHARTHTHTHTRTHTCKLQSVDVALLLQAQLDSRDAWRTQLTLRCPSHFEASGVIAYLTLWLTNQSHVYKHVCERHHMCEATHVYANSVIVHLHNSGNNYRSLCSNFVRSCHVGEQCASCGTASNTVLLTDSTCAKLCKWVTPISIEHAGRCIACTMIWKVHVRTIQCWHCDCLMRAVAHQQN